MTSYFIWFSLRSSFYHFVTETRRLSIRNVKLVGKNFSGRNCEIFQDVKRTFDSTEFIVVFRKSKGKYAFLLEVRRRKSDRTKCRNFLLSFSVNQKRIHQRTFALWHNEDRFEFGFQRLRCRDARRLRIAVRWTNSSRKNVRFVFLSAKRLTSRFSKWAKTEFWTVWRENGGTIVLSVSAERRKFVQNRKSIFFFYLNFSFSGFETEQRFEFS